MQGQNDKQEKIYKKVDSYVFDKENLLGQGSYGKVYSGVDSRTGMQVAVKVIPMTFLQNPVSKAVENLKNEIKNMHLVNHQNIVKLHDVKKYHKQHPLFAGQPRTAPARPYHLSQIPSERGCRPLLNSPPRRSRSCTLALLHNHPRPRLILPFRSPNNLYLIVEYCNSGSLEKLLQERKGHRLPEHVMLNIMKQIVSGFRVLYESQIVHR